MESYSEGGENGHEPHNMDINEPESSSSNNSADIYSTNSYESEGSADGRLSPPGHQHAENEAGQREVLLGDRLCPCTPVTEGDAMLMCLALGMRHNMTWLAIIDILKLINILFDREVVHATKYYLMKYFEVGQESTNIHIYCPVCQAYLGTKETIAEEQILHCDCGEEVKPFGQSASYFVSVNLKCQFRKLMETAGVADEIMTYRFQRKKVNDEAIEDIFDGAEYKKLSGNGELLSSPYNFSVTMNTDGMALTKSSKSSAWPIFLYVNELSPQNRKKHIIFAGIWVGNSQPNMRIFLKPFALEMRDIITDGFQWCDNEGNEHVSKVLPLIAVLDSGARYKFLNLTSHTGYYGCTFCYQKAERTTKGPRFTVPQRPAALRTQESMMEDMQIAHQNRDHPVEKLRVHRGCKGLTPLLHLHPYLNLGSGVIVDYMHNGLLGVTRHFVKLVLGTAGKDYYVGDPDNLNILNSRLTRIRPPRSITRTPRLLDDRKTWHANEWRSFLLFYGYLCFDGVLGRKYLEQFCMLSSAFYLLLQKSICDEDIVKAERYLLQYVYLAQRHFGKKQMHYNVHILIHVCKAVRDWGPLWTHNTFVFETENRHLGQMHTSPGRVALQLTRRYLTFRSLPKLCEKYASSETPLDFIEDITGRKLVSFLRCGQTVLIGQGTSKVLAEEEERCIAEAGIQHPANIKSYSRMFYKGVQYTTREYSIGKKNDDAWVKLSGEMRGSIEQIYCLESDAQQLVILMVKEIRVSRIPIFRTANVVVDHIKRVTDVGELRAVKPSKITSQCIYIDLDTGNYIVDMAFGCYGD
jgi:hypothetical protein